MSDKNPTEAQIKEFWEWCGWGYMSGLGLISPEGEDYVPPIDLNNLFKYAVPKLRESMVERYKYTCYRKEHIEGGLSQFYFKLDSWVSQLVDPKVDPALSLFWAIWQAKEIK